jgi:hypothetical protein
MPMTPNDVIAGGYRMAKALVHRMTDDLAPAEFFHQPVPGANSAAWVVGHLALTLRRTAERLGATDLPAVPADLADRFAATKKPAVEQSGLGDPAELMRLFDTCLDRVIERVKAVLADELAGASPYPIAANYAEALLFGSLHVAMHSGQLSTLRRSLSKPPVV